MCRSDVKLRSLNSFFNLDGCVYYLTKKDQFVRYTKVANSTQSVCKLETLFGFGKNAETGVARHTTTNEIVRRNIQSVTSSRVLGTKCVVVVVYEDGVYEDRYSDLPYL